ncbi:MAG: YaiI/YqxD family protein [Clostridia bacterium]|nr:YaiI/YqxD family protein [Clostridia bacterium]
MKIFIDADGCPVVDITVRIAKKYSLECFIICDTAHEFQKEGAKTVVVEKGADSVDFRLVNLVSAGDIVVTQDYGLAAMCLARKAVPLSQNGLVFTDKNIDELLFSRYVSKKIRNAGGRLKGPSKRTDEQDKRFEEVLEKLIQQ